MRTAQSLVHRREKENAKKARWRARKEAIRLASDEPIRGEWRGRFAFTITYQSRITGVFHSLDFYLSQKRVNSFRVKLDGKPWREQVSATDAMAWLRRKLPKFSLRT
jgi:hypothetical protein